MWLKDLSISLLAIVSFIEIGLLTDYYIISKRTLNFHLAIFFGLGVGCVAILQMIFAIFQIPVSDNLVKIITIISFFPIVLDRHLRKQLLSSAKNFSKKIESADILIFLILLIFVSCVALITFSHPVWGFDELARWLAKARAFYLDNGIFAKNVAVYLPADDPNLWPLAAAWFYHLLGKSSDFWVQIIPLVTFLALIGEFLRRVVSQRIIKFAWVSILAFTPLLWNTATSYSYSGNADLLVSFYFLLAFAALFYKQPVYTAIFLGLAALTKNDALPALVAFCFLLPIFKLQSKAKLDAVFLAGLALLFFNIGWKIFFHLDSRYLQNDIRSVLRQRPVFEYTKYSLHAFREEFRQINHWGLGFWVIIFFLVTRIRRIFKDKWFVLGILLLAAQFAGYIWVYYVTREDQASQIATSIYRLVLQVYPSLLLLAYVVSNSKGFKSGVKT